MKLERKKYYIILATIIALSLFFAIYSITLNVKTKKEIVTDRYVFTDTLNYYVYLKPNHLFNTTVLKNSMIYTNITREIVVVYSFFSKSSSSVHGKYKVIAEIKTNEWNKAITIIPEKTFRNSYTLNFPINLDLFKGIYDTINRELGFKGTEPKVIITIKTDIRAKNYSDTYTHSLSFPLISKAFKITTQHTTSKVKTFKKTVYVFDSGKNLIRIATAVLSVIFFLSACIFYLKVKPMKIEKDMATVIYERNKDFIILGKIETARTNVVIVESIDELLRTAEILNKPIIKDGKKFGLIDGQTIYIFEFRE